MNLRVTLCFLIGMLVGLHPTTTAAQRQLAPLPIREALASRGLPAFMPIDLSPNGQLVAYTLQDTSKKSETADSGSPSSGLTRTGTPRRGLYCDVWISDVETGEATNLSQGQGSSWGPVWSPDGQRLAFYSDRSGAQSVWVWERSSRIQHQVSTEIIRVNSESAVVRWLRDSNKIVVTVLPEGMSLTQASDLLTDPLQPKGRHQSEREPGSTVVIYHGKTIDAEHDSEQARGQNEFLKSLVVDLVLLDVKTGKVRRLLKRVNVNSWWVSPDGVNVAVLISKGYESLRSLQALYDLLVVSLTNGSSRIAVPNFKGNNLMTATWSPDGEWLAYLTDGPQTGTDCFVIRTSGGEPRNLTTASHPRFENSILRGPLWDEAGRNLYLLNRDALWRLSVADGTLSQVVALPGRVLEDILVIGPSVEQGKHWLMLLTRDDKSKREGVYQVDLASGNADKISEENESYGGVTAFYKTDVSSDRRRVVYTAQRADRPEDIWFTGSDFKDRRQVTHINQVFDRYLMGELRVIEWHTTEGQLVRGALLLPAGYEQGRRYPLIVYQYPGSMWSNYANKFGLNPFSTAVENWQILATRGYAIFVPDVPTKAGTYMQDIAKAVLPGVDKVIELGIADPERLGITGQSNGGYGVLSLIVQTKRFKAAVDRMGQGNLIGQYTQMLDNGTSVYMAAMEARTGGSLWEKRDKFIENSPIFYFDRVQTPLLIIQGTSDTQVMSARSDEVFVSLRFLGKEVEYAKYVGESHGVSGWSYANQIDYLNRMIRWFDKYLKAPESPTKVPQ